MLRSIPYEYPRKYSCQYVLVHVGCYFRNGFSTSFSFDLRGYEYLSSTATAWQRGSGSCPIETDRQQAVYFLLSHIHKLLCSRRYDLF